MTIERIAVLGVGRVGTLAARLLHRAGFAVTGCDLSAPKEPLPFPVKRIDLTSHGAMVAAFGRVDAVLSCLTYHLNRGVASEVASPIRTAWRLS